MATLNGAKAQGRTNIGKLAPGFEADLIMLNVHSPHMQPVYSPAATAAYAANGGDVCLTMVQGKVLYENGEWKTIDIERTIAEVNRIAVPIVLNN
jgi:5-methylthioadenosine/S-adenosylhomocysteine deaminase